MSSYAEFRSAKVATRPTSGITVTDEDIHPLLFPFQRDLVRWSLAKGRGAIFADTGLGKTFMQLEWARLTGERALILAPLAVALQTVREASRIGIDLTYARKQSDAADLTVTNYEMLGSFDVDAFGAVVLDESSILKSFDGKTRTSLIESFAETPYRLCCTATPAPNDISELANHAEFLGICSRVEMLATFFVHDDAGWRLKGHAQEPFYRWLASWGMSLRKPSDLGYSDEGYDLPGLDILPHFVPCNVAAEGQLFSVGLKGIGHRSAVRRDTLAIRVARAAELINGSSEPWIAWVGLNDEGYALAAAVPDAILVEGSQSQEAKADLLERFIAGQARVLITKPTIAGFGLNLQHCAHMVFVGLSDSYEQYYQCIRRCYRFGQTRPVEAHVVLSEPEDAIYQNILRKARDSDRAAAGMIRHVAQYERAEIANRTGGEWIYMAEDTTGSGWTLSLGDSCERIYELEPESIDLSVFSPPFQSLYTYSATERDIGNNASKEAFWSHFCFIIDGLLLAMKPGRNVVVHVAQVPTTLAAHGVIGLRDFRGDTIRAFTERGFVYHGEVCIDKDPQAQAIRTHSKGLLFAQLRKDASWLRPALADYVLVFRTPGENAVPILPDISNDEWIHWARPVWYGIRETHTLNVAEARSEKDERHICPLQLGTIERVIRLWSNPGELVLSPFAGIGSEGYESIRLGRRFTGIELKPEYYNTAVRNLRAAERARDEDTLLAFCDGGAQAAETGEREQTMGDARVIGAQKCPDTAMAEVAT